MQTEYSMHDFAAFRVEWDPSARGVDGNIAALCEKRGRSFYIYSMGFLRTLSLWPRNLI